MIFIKKSMFSIKINRLKFFLNWFKSNKSDLKMIFFCNWFLLIPQALSLHNNKRYDKQLNALERFVNIVAQTIFPSIVFFMFYIKRSNTLWQQYVIFVNQIIMEKIEVPNLFSFDQIKHSQKPWRDTAEHLPV